MKRALILLFTAVLVPVQTEVEITAEPHHHFMFENESVRVFSVDVAPHAATLMHWHRHDYIFVTLGASHVSNDVEGKAPVEMKLPDGDTRLLPAPFAHIARNLSDQPFRNVTIEVMQDSNLRQVAKEGKVKWDEDRGLDILEGGTKEILWVTDGIRATEFELQPGGVVPLHHHTGPHLLVAISDLEIRSDVEGQGPMPGHFKSGDSKWLPGGYSHSIINLGKQPAKFVTLEFP